MTSHENLLAIIPIHHIGSCKYEKPPDPDCVRATQSITNENQKIKIKNFWDIKK